MSRQLSPVGYFFLCTTFLPPLVIARSSLIIFASFGSIGLVHAFTPRGNSRLPERTSFLFDFAAIATPLQPNNNIETRSVISFIAVYCTAIGIRPSFVIASFGIGPCGSCACHKMSHFLTVATYLPEHHAPMTLQNSDLVAFAATTNPARARAFYCDLLGLHLLEDTPFALVIQTPNATLRIQKVQPFTPLPFTALGWTVADIRATARELQSKGVTFERFQGLAQDDLAIWTSPSGAKVCWFKDPDGNILSLTQLA